MPPLTDSFPLVYCNGDSYSNNNYHESLRKSTYDFIVADALNGFNINNAVSGSCNRRIIRTSVADLVEQREINPSQRIIALIGLTFDMRFEFWNEKFLKTPLHQINDTNSVFEGDFLSLQFTTMPNWFSVLRKGIRIQKLPKNTDINFKKKFFDMLNNVTAFFFNPSAEVINLFCDLIMFRALLDTLNIEFLIFNCAPTDVTYTDNALIEHFSKIVFKDSRFIKFNEGFSFCSYLADKKFVPLDSVHNPSIGHFGSDAHEHFAKTILLPRLSPS
jgi:hypothetical protein